jgi:hypothetical protein
VDEQLVEWMMTHPIGDPPDPDEIAGLFHRPDWHERAACRGMGPEYFYAERGHPFAPALAACRRCPVHDECLAAAIDAGDDHGIWGGTGGERRRKVLRSGA